MTANRSRGGAATEIALKAKVAPANRDAAAAVGDAEGGADAAEGIETTHRAATALRGGSKTGLRRTSNGTTAPTMSSALRNAVQPRSRPAKSGGLPSRDATTTPTASPAAIETANEAATGAPTGAVNAAATGAVNAAATGAANAASPPAVINRPPRPDSIGMRRSTGHRPRPAARPPTAPRHGEPNVTMTDGAASISNPANLPTTWPATAPRSTANLEATRVTSSRDGAAGGGAVAVVAVVAAGNVPATIAPPPSRGAMNRLPSRVATMARRMNRFRPGTVGHPLRPGRLPAAKGNRVDDAVGDGATGRVRRHAPAPPQSRPRKGPRRRGGDAPPGGEAADAVAAPSPNSVRHRGSPVAAGMISRRWPEATTRTTKVSTSSGSRMPAGKRREPKPAVAMTTNCSPTAGCRASPMCRVGWRRSASSSRATSTLATVRLEVATITTAVAATAVGAAGGEALPRSSTPCRFVPDSPRRRPTRLADRTTRDRGECSQGNAWLRFARPGTEPYPAETQQGCSLGGSHAGDYFSEIVRASGLRICSTTQLSTTSWAICASRLIAST